MSDLKRRAFLQTLPVAAGFALSNASIDLDAAQKTSKDTLACGEQLTGVPWTQQPLRLHDAAVDDGQGGTAGARGRGLRDRAEPAVRTRRSRPVRMMTGRLYDEGTLLAAALAYEHARGPITARPKLS